MTVLEEIVQRSPRLRPATKRGYRHAVSSFLDFAGRSPHGWVPRVVENWRDHIASSRSPQTANTYLACLRGVATRLAKREGDPRFDFTRGVEKYAVEGRGVKDVEPLTHAEVRKILATCRGKLPIDLRDRAMLVLMLRTGLRRSSVCAAALEDLRGSRLTVTAKGGKLLTIVLGRDALSALSPWIAYLQRKDIRKGPLFRSLACPRLDPQKTQVEASLSPDGLYKALKARASAAGVEGFHPHRLRHTFVTWCRAAGIPDWKIAQVTGHSIKWSSGGPQAAMLDNYTGRADTALEDLLPRLEP